MSRSKNRRRDKAKADAAKAAQPKVTIVNGRTRTETRNPPPADLDPDLHWYLVYTAPRAEPKVVKALGEAGCSVFWPSVHVTVTAPKRKPLEMDVGTFPRYLFAAGMPFRQQRRTRREGDRIITIDGRPIDDIRDIDGVVEVVGTAAGWQRVPSAAIAAIAGYQATQPEPKAQPQFMAGDMAVVIDGPFMTFSATVVEAIGLQKAKVLIDILGGKVLMTMDVRQLDAA